jgi:hypothetical protein
MFGSTLKRSFAALAVTGGLLAIAGPAGAIAYNGHAGLGSSAAAVTDGTSNTMMLGEFSIDIGTSEQIAADGLGADYVKKDGRS